jgi:hypothetical protein
LSVLVFDVTANQNCGKFSIFILQIFYTGRVSWAHGADGFIFRSRTVRHDEIWVNVSWEPDYTSFVEVSKNVISEYSTK